ncbi:MAG: 2-dehydropantoate 2-reductase [Myxococcales bacterium]|nr:2-dehydropantoate 2-reductase [Myxococcales bacterium]
MADPLKLGVFGAGAIGGYLGLRLAAGGAEVVLHGRQWLVDVADELCAFDLEGKRLAPSVRVVSDARALSEVDVCLVTVKSAQTLGAAEELREVLRPGALVVSFQNGLRNAERLRQTLREQTIVPGMVSFNVVIEGDKCFRQATSGPLSAGRVLGSGLFALERLEACFGRGGLPLELHHDIGNVQAGKLLVNLNNGVSAAVGMTIKDAVSNRDIRRCFAACVSEGLDVFRRTGLRPAKVVALPPGLIVKALPLPDAVFLRIAKSLVKIDPRAKSSTLQDLERGRRTEIDDLNGEVVDRARSAGLAAPANQVIVDVIRELEGAALARQALRFLTPEELWRRIASARA